MGIGGVVERRVLQLEDEVQELRRQLHRLAEAEAFQREVVSLPSTPGARSPPQAAKESLRAPV